MQNNSSEDGRSGSPTDEHRIVKADDIFKGERSVLIDYSGTLYQLRVTSQNKLILTKPHNK